MVRWMENYTACSDYRIITSTYSKVYSRISQCLITSSNRAYNLKWQKYWEIYWYQAGEFCVYFFLCLLQHSYASLHIRRQQKQFQAQLCPWKKEMALPPLGLLSLRGGIFSQNSQASCPLELIGEDQVIRLCSAARKDGKRSSGSFHLYKGRLVLPIRNERSGGRWLKCVK